MTTDPWGCGCTCRWGERALGRLHGVDMGRGIVRLSTTVGCPEHDSCRGFTKAHRATRPRWSNPWCPIHRNTPCPDTTDQPESPDA